MSVKEKMTAIADAIRDKTGGTEKLSIDAMAEEIPKVYDAGKEAEQQTFWETYQRGGRRVQYRNAFYDGYWTDVNYNPKYPIVCSALSASAFEYCGITDTKVDITVSSTNTTNVFRNCASLKTIRKLIVTEGVVFTNWFSGCTALENITFDGVIGQNLDIRWSPLTHDSLMSIINALKDYSADTSGTTYTLTIGGTNLEKLTQEEIDIIINKRWEYA